MTDGGVTGAFDYMPSSERRREDGRKEGRKEGRREGGRSRSGVKPTLDVHIPSTRACVSERVTAATAAGRAADSSSLVCEARRISQIFNTEGEKRPIMMGPKRNMPLLVVW